MSIGCRKCGSYSTCGCNNHCPEENSCGCTHNHSTKCSFYYGDTLSCIDVQYGDDLETILTNINTAVCAITPSGSTSTVVNSCNSNIAVTNPSTGVYTVCLNQDIPDQITENTSNISDLNACITNTVKDLISDSLTVTEESSDSCGRTLRVEYNPSGFATTEDGIIYNDLDKSGTTATSGIQILKSFNNNYVTSSSITTGDEIRFQITGSIDAVVAGVASVIIELYDSNTATVIDSTTYSAFSSIPGAVSSFIFDGVIALQSSTSGRYTLKMLAANVADFNFGNCTTSAKIYDVNVIDFTALTIRAKFNNFGSANGGNNYVHKLMVEVRKKI